MEEKRYYIAYGSNLHLKQMHNRCPNAKVVGSGELQGYGLVFKGKDYGACATIEPREGGMVPVLIWELGGNDEKALDRYEGYPKLYTKSMMETEVNGETISAMVYVMRQDRKIGKPSDIYLKIITEGYENAGFDTKGLQEAYQHSQIVSEEAWNACQRSLQLREPQ